MDFKEGDLVYHRVRNKVFKVSCIPYSSGIDKDKVLDGVDVIKNESGYTLFVRSLELANENQIANAIAERIKNGYSN